jgi:hypothetical protein
MVLGVDVIVGMSAGFMPSPHADRARFKDTTPEKTRPRDFFDLLSITAPALSHAAA